MASLNDPTLRSFVPVTPESHFPIQNLPFGVFSRTCGGPRVGIGIGDFVLDLKVLAEELLLGTKLLEPDFFLHQQDLNEFMQRGTGAWTEIRGRVSRLLRHDTPTLRDNAALRARSLVLQSDIRMHLPARIENYTDFYSSKEHATNVGTMMRGPENALMPHWL